MTSRHWLWWITCKLTEFLSLQSLNQASLFVTTTATFVQRANRQTQSSQQHKSFIVSSALQDNNNWPPPLHGWPTLLPSFASNHKKMMSKIAEKWYMDPFFSFSYLKVVGTLTMKNQPAANNGSTVRGRLAAEFVDESELFSSCGPTVCTNADCEGPKWHVKNQDRILFEKGLCWSNDNLVKKQTYRYSYYSNDLKQKQDYS